MERNRLVIGLLFVLFLVAAVKIPAIPAEYQATASYQASGGHGGESADGGGHGGSDGTADDGGSGSLGPSADVGPSAMVATQEYEVPVAFTIANVTATTAAVGETGRTTVAIRNDGETGGTFTVTIRYRPTEDASEDAEPVTVERTVAIEPNATGTVAHTHGDLPRPVTAYAIDVAVEPPTRTVRRAEEPETSETTRTVTVTVRDRKTLLGYLTS